MPAVNNKGVKINYEIAGKGNAIVCLHGYSGSAQDWANQFDAFSPNYQVIAIDERGHGKSAAPIGEDAYSVPVFAEDTLAVLKGLGIKRCCLAGHSLGGAIVLHLVLEHPEMVAGLILVDTAAEFARVPAMTAMREKLNELARTQGLEAAFEYECANNPQRMEMFKKNPEMKEKQRQKVLTLTVDSYIYTWKALGKVKSFVPRLSGIKVPTIIFLGDEDMNMAGAVQVLNKGIANSELVTIKGAGHNPHEDNPADFNKALLGFLGKVRW